MLTPVQLRRDRGFDGERMPAERRVEVELDVGDFRGGQGCSEWSNAARDRLGERDDVGLDVEQLAREPAATATERGADLVHDHERAIAVTQLDEPFHERG